MFVFPLDKEEKVLVIYETPFEQKRLDKEIEEEILEIDKTSPFTPS